MDVSLSRGWTLRGTGETVPEAVAGRRVPAVVPGCVHLDLLAAGLIADPFLDENEALAGWIARADWRYDTSFDWASAGDDEVDLVAMGLDTVATVELNGTTVAQTRNMHRSYRFPIAGLLRAGSNELAVKFSSALTAAEQLSRQLGPLPATVDHPINAIRKMACNFGADWGPELITAGIWRPLSLQSWSVARLAHVRPLVDVDGSTGLLHVHVDVQRASGHDEPLTVDASIAGLRTSVAIAAGQRTAVVEVAVPDAELWWPHGRGDQTLYPLVVLC